MGIYRSTPLTEKDTQSGSNDHIAFASCGMQGSPLKLTIQNYKGWRVSMEDAHINDLELGDGMYIFGVFDGHGGMEVSEYVKRHFVEELKQNKNFQKGNYPKALTENFMQMDKIMLTPDGKQELIDIKTGNDEEASESYAGCTANVCLFVKDTLYVANAGDSRTLLCTEGKPYPMSIDHKPDDEIENKRITAAGGFITDGRINGNLNLSRCIGDFEYKKDENLSKKEQLIIAYPDVKVRKLRKADEFLILGCDGVWETKTNEEIVQFVRKKLAKPGSDTLAPVVELLLDVLIARDTSTGLGCDNMSAIIVDLRNMNLE